MLTLIEMANNFLEETNIGNSAIQTGMNTIDEEKEKEEAPKEVEKSIEKVEKVVPALEYKVGDEVLYKPTGGDYGEKTVGKVLNIMKNDVTVKTADDTILIWTKQFVMPKPQKSIEKIENME